MRCETARARLQEWFDEPGVTALPPELGEHVRECTECRSFITRWNTIELRLQALKEEAPRLSPDQVMALRARMRGPAVRTSRRIDMSPFRYAVVTAAAAAVLAAMLYGLSGMRMATSPVHSAASIVVRPDGAPTTSAFNPDAR